MRRLAAVVATAALAAAALTGCDSENWTQACTTVEASESRCSSAIWWYGTPSAVSRS